MTAERNTVTAERNGYAVSGGVAGAAADVAGLVFGTWDAIGVGMNTQNWSVESEHGQAMGEGMTLEQARRAADAYCARTGEPCYVVAPGYEPELHEPE